VRGLTPTPAKAGCSTTWSSSPKGRKDIAPLGELPDKIGVRG